MLIATPGKNGQDSTALINMMTCGMVTKNPNEAGVIVCWNLPEVMENLGKYSGKHFIIFSYLLEAEAVPYQMPENCEWVGDERLNELAKMTDEQFRESRQLAA